MKIIMVMPAVALMSVMAFAEDDEFLVKPAAVNVSNVESVRSKKEVQQTKAAQPKEKFRKCYKCFGKGKQTVNVREACERCEGTGNIEVEVELKDTVNGRYWYESSYRTTRKVQTKKPCPQCKRRGMIPVKKEVDCPKCKGTGMLTKDGKPAPVDSVNDDKITTDADVEEEEQTSPKGNTMSLADRIRAGNQVKLGANEITVATDRGWAEFDFKANGGKFTVRNKEAEFITRWSSCGPDAVYAYKDYVEMVGCKAGQRQMPYAKDDFETFDWSHRSVIAHAGDVIVFMNHGGRFLAVKVMKVRDRERGADADLLHIEFRIY